MKGKKLGYFVLAAMVSGLTACSGTAFRKQNESILRHHVIAINQDGHALDPVNLEVQRDTAVCGRMVREVVDSAVQAVGQGRVKRIVFFVHGGLNTFKSSLGRAVTLQKDMLKDSAYPVFIVWKSGPLSTYWEHLWRVRQGRVNNAYWTRPLAAPVVFVTDVATGVARSPMILIQNGFTDAKSALPWADANPDSIAAQVRREAASGAATIDIAKGGDGRSGWDKAGKFSVYMLTLPFKWLSAPVIDMFGTPDWNIMLRRTTTMFRASEEFDIRSIRRDSSRLVKHLDAAPTGALSKALTYLDAKTRGKGVRIDLIGHSMGAIVSNQVLLNFPEIKFKNIVYMAPACKVKDFNEYVVPYLTANRRDDVRFYNLTLHPIAERRETNAYDLVQRGSLLEWIDNFFSRPNNTDERTLGKYENILQCAHVIPKEVRPRITVKTFGVGKTAEDQPQRHGGFSNYAFWNEAFWSNKPVTDTTKVRFIPDVQQNAM